MSSAYQAKTLVVLFEVASIAATYTSASSWGGAIEEQLSPFERVFFPTPRWSLSRSNLDGTPDGAESHLSRMLRDGLIQNNYAVACCQ